MSETAVKRLIEQIMSEGYTTPFDLFEALNAQTGVSVTHINNQFDLQLLFCEFGSLYEKLKYVDLSFLGNVNFMDTYLASDQNIDEVYWGGNDIFKEHERLYGKFPTYAPGGTQNTLFEIIVALLRSKCSPKFANLGSAADVKGFVQAANMLKNKGHKQQSLMKLLFIVHQLWVPSRMLAFADAVEKRKR